MGCFLGCFGLSTKRKRRKPANKVLPGHQRYLSYEPLDSSVSVVPDIARHHLTSSDPDQIRSNKPEQQHPSIKVKKKVSFNLNVQAYEPIPKEEIAYHSWESDEEEKKKESCESIAKGSQFPSRTQGDSAAMRMGSYPANYRYQNVRDSYDEDEGIAYESDLDDYYEDDDSEDDDDNIEDDDDDQIDDQRVCQEELPKQFNSLSMESKKRDSLNKLSEDKTNNNLPLCASTDREMKSTELNRNARDRSQYVHSVLNPIENLTQWKAVKAKAAAAAKRARKENTESHLSPPLAAPNYHQSRPLLQDIAVDSSLSNWLASSNHKDSKTETIKSSSITVNNKSAEKIMFERSYCWRSREDMPILDITSLEV